MIKFSKFNNFQSLQFEKIIEYFKCSNNWEKKIIRNKFLNKIIDWLIFRYFSIRNFEIPKYWSFYI